MPAEYGMQRPGGRARAHMAETIICPLATQSSVSVPEAAAPLGIDIRCAADSRLLCLH